MFMQLITAMRMMMMDDDDGWWWRFLMERSSLNG